MEHLNPTETARRLGVTVKALKLYERKGLVRPMRAANGWRVYGPEQILRLHEVLALKSLGLPLKDIAALVAGGGGDLDRTLALQAEALSERRGEIDHALARIAQVRAGLAAGTAPSTADLLALARETALGAPDWGRRIYAYYRSHLGEAGMAALTPSDPELWTSLIEALRSLTADRVSPRAPAAQAFLARWLAASHAVSGGDETLNAGAYAAWMEALDDPATAKALPIGRAEIDYLRRVAAARAARS